MLFYQRSIWKLIPVPRDICIVRLHTNLKLAPQVEDILQNPNLSNVKKSWEIFSIVVTFSQSFWIFTANFIAQILGCWNPNPSHLFECKMFNANLVNLLFYVPFLLSWLKKRISHCCKNFCSYSGKIYYNFVKGHNFQRKSPFL